MCVFVGIFVWVLSCMYHRTCVILHLLQNRLSWLIYPADFRLAGLKASKESSVFTSISTESCWEYRWCYLIWFFLASGDSDACSTFFPRKPLSHFLSPDQRMSGIKCWHLYLSFLVPKEKDCTIYKWHWPTKGKFYLRSQGRSYDSLLCESKVSHSVMPVFTVTEENLTIPQLE